MREMKIEMPRGKKEISIMILLLIIILYAIMIPIGRFSGGRFGIINVVGDSMMNIFPWGSQVFVAPFAQKDNSYVVAWVDGDENLETIADMEGGYVVKLMVGNQLKSTSVNQSYTKFDYRGRVLFSIPIQKVLRWRDKGGQNPWKAYQWKAYHKPTAEKVVEAVERTKKQQYAYAVNRKISKEIVPVIISEKYPVHIEVNSLPVGLSAQKTQKTLVINFGRSCSISSFDIDAVTNNQPSASRLKFELSRDNKAWEIVADVDFSNIHSMNKTINIKPLTCRYMRCSMIIFVTYPTPPIWITVRNLHIYGF